MTEWQLRFMRLAQEAATWSKDQDCAVGAVLVSPDNRKFSFGYNGFPKGIEDTQERMQDNVLKNSLTIHAEVNAILNYHDSVEGYTLYVTKAPCHICAGQLIQAGISMVVCPPVKENSKWTYSCQLAQELFSEAGVKVLTDRTTLIHTESGQA